MNRDKALYDLETAARDLASIIGDGSGMSLADLTAIADTCTTVQTELIGMLRKCRESLEITTN